MAADFIGDPDLLAEPEFAVRSAMWFWQSHGLNALADANAFTKISRIINGGLAGLEDRRRRWEAAKSALA